MSPRGLLLLGIGGHLALLPVAVRHLWFWGEGREVLGIPLPALLHAGEVAGLILFTLLCGWSYLGVAARSHQLPLRWLFGGACLLTLAAVIVPPFLSSDVFDYVLRGRVESVHGGNPYVNPPADYPDDPLLGEAQWPGFVMPYGPITQVVQYCVSLVAGDSLWIAVYGFKLVSAVAHLLCGWLVYLTLAGRGEDTARRGLQLYLWNPFLLLELAGSAHNEALMAAFLALLAWGLAGQRMVLATVAFGAAVLCKHGIAPLGPCLLILAWRQRQLREFATGVAIVAAGTAVLALRYFLEPGALDFLFAQTGNRATSLQHFATLLIGDSRVFLYFGYAAAAAALIWAGRGIRDAASFANRGASVMLVFILFSMPLFSPWYHLWWIPLLGLWTWTALHQLVIALAFLGPLSYFVVLANRSLGLDYQIAQWTLGLVLPLAWVARLQRRAP